MCRQIYKLLLIWLGVLAGGLLLSTPLAQAGGWAVITLDQLPTQVVAEQSITVGFMVRQHGQRPMEGLTPQVTAVHSPTGESFTVAARAEGDMGHYSASLTFPQAGVWNWSIQAFSMDQPLPALTVMAAAELGQELFVAKGCLTCHRHQAVPEVPNIMVDVGPNLTHYPTTAEYLRVWLKDPAAIKPTTQMPNLGLNQTEIEALTAFLLNDKPASAAASPAPVKPASQAPLAGLPKTNGKSAELFLIRAQGAKGPLVAFDMAGQVERFRLPAGMLAADRSHYYAAVASKNSTLLEVFNPQTSQLEAKWTLTGRWSLSGVSPTGRWLALTHLPAETANPKAIKTEIQIIDSTSGEVAHSLDLDGNFEVETISASGDALFLIQHLPAVNPTQYLIRLYDLSAEHLQPDPLRAKTATDKVMTGLAWGGVASADGRWLLTLYLNTSHQVAFVHALNLVDKFPVCIDLPSGAGEFEQLKYYTLTLDPAGWKVYAANAALGLVAEINLNEFRVTRQVKFAASPVPLWAGDANPDVPTNYSVLSPDGSTLYFSSGWDVWGYDIKAGKVNGPYLGETQVKGLGLSADGQHLYVATDRQPLIVELGKDKSLSFKLD
jgi:cytochrome c2